MNPKLLLGLALVLTTFIIGVALGVYLEHRRCIHMVSDTEVSDQFGQVAETYLALHYLRTGETNGAFSQLEDRLDDAIVSLSSVMEKYPTSERATNYHKFLQTVANYRATYPYHNEDTNTDFAVAAALAKFSKGKP